MIVETFKLNEEVWMIGKGPSLDKFDPTKAGQIICLNETVFLIPNAFATIAIDYKVLNIYRDKKIKTLVLKKKSHAQYSFENEWHWDRKQVTISMAATAPIAIQLCYNAGARIFHFVGFDSVYEGYGYANKIKSIKAEGTNRDNYVRINKAVLEVIYKLNINAIWEGRNG